MSACMLCNIYMHACMCIRAYVHMYVRMYACMYVPYLVWKILFGMVDTKFFVDFHENILATKIESTETFKYTYTTNLLQC